MKEQENTKLVQMLYSAFSKGDIATIMDRLTPDVKWAFEGSNTLPFTGRRSGPGEVLQFFEAIGTTQDEQLLTMDSYIAQGDTVAATGRFSALVKATGKRYDAAVAHVFTIRDGKVAKFEEYGDTSGAVAAFTA